MHVCASPVYKFKKKEKENTQQEEKQENKKTFRARSM